MEKRRKMTSIWNRWNLLRELISLKIKQS